ncbi:inhibitor of growth protein 3 [Takifugu rubripes]|uniref:Inhibitor of growth protein n=1 Tax=Takifugu rubripes TaxID=31033 RepID=A0A3B5KM17_TAKRU|nr:inhibitor of growth protein 3 [Takifugu rubripes]XP_056878377.1 inhibitor of growth protein 3 [Takifugu flavidus]|eukprot:XP_003976740.1 PREDICTED: inhibitor of growth protein 3 [Takifugu rubripes]
MLYLEDYLEMIEQLPMDLRDRFTEMREMDLQVQNATDQLEQKVNEFFVNAKKNKPEWREEQMEVIKKDYYKALEDADEKVQLANQIYDLVDRHLRKLDQELAKFKMELEADNAGITEILERRSLEMDSPSQPVNNHHVHSHTTTEKRKYSTPLHHTTEHIPEKKFKSEALLSTLTSDASKENTPGCRTNSTPSSANSVYSVNSSQPLASYNLSALPAGPGAGAGAITMAAAQAVQATAQMKDGRRTSSLKASYEAIKNNDFQLGREFSLSRDGTGYSSSALASTLTQTLAPNTTSDSRGRKSKSSIKSSNHQSSSSSSSSSLSSCSSSSALAQELSQQASVLPEPEANSQVDWTYDPNEPRYCICNQVSYGEMVGCDNTDCPIEWFHYGCVGLSEAPKGKWYCPQCTAAMKRRGSRHK